MKKRNVIAFAVVWTQDRRVHGGAAVIGGGFAFVIVLIQQMAIWESALGWLLVATLGLITLASGLMLRSDFVEEGAPGPA